eukprot:CAMPEP_0206145818 /NCGR_PEP_ID=MMETSP1473-20131121/28590_1 /ASSEMBLY_ACC=CAM_ASM_001109 /TAXON_ID=1461547 /ORGANISM="Stichococcus sp, Strain RCC1054" /LENGTH=650 /DNA_ID=CAMNT_0053542175 /DNA_START=146 /DNA_END=2099 /DNA_ORIENTATION=-
MPSSQQEKMFVQVAAHGSASHDALSDLDFQHIRRAAAVADGSAGLSQPHPNAGCVLVSQDGRPLCETFQRAQGTTSAEAQAVTAVRADAEGTTAYLNLEPGDVHGDDSAVQALLQAGVARVVIGMRHPLSHLRGHAVGLLRSAGVRVDVVGEARCDSSLDDEQATLQECLQANEALLHRAKFKRPFGILKYAMTLDGKIATSSGHAAWISSPISRQMVFDTRARSHAVVVGGNTVRRDDPRLTTRRDGGHQPTRIVMTQKLDLPEDANLWDVSSAATIIMTQRGARAAFQQRLRDKGVEVVEFDFLTPDKVAQYCYKRGYLQVLWECGGKLAAPAITDGTIHKAMAFIAPKLVGGVQAPTPVGELGNVEMTQALQLLETRWQPTGPDMLLTGYLPATTGLWGLQRGLVLPSEGSRLAAAPQEAAAHTPPAPTATGAGLLPKPVQRRPEQVAPFYKPWDQYGVLSNFTPHWVDMPTDSPSQQQAGEPQQLQRWPSVEHYYQAHKFASAAATDPAAASLVQAIRAASSPEEAAALGRRAEREQPHLLPPDWATVKLSVMLDAVRAKFAQHAGPRAMLLATASGKLGPLELVEDSPHDAFWGCGADGTGSNHLGRILTRVRSELLAHQLRQPEANSQWQLPQTKGSLTHSGIR